MRTSLQHLWAELSEKVADVFDPLIKYGGGNSLLSDLHLRFSSAIEDAEIKEVQISAAEKVLSDLFTSGRLSRRKKDELREFRKELGSWHKKLDLFKKTILDTLRELIDKLENSGRG